MRDFFQSHHTYVILPNKRSVSGKDFTQKIVLGKTVTSLHKDYLALGNKGSLSTLKRYRPKHCSTVNHNKCNACLCEYCTNIEMKISSLKSHSNQIPKDKSELSNITLCDNLNMSFGIMGCINRKCSKCGVKQLQDLFRNLPHHQVSWRKWENGEVKDSQGNTPKRKILVGKSTDELCYNLITMKNVPGCSRRRR
ncbi:hypothetical protein KP79_PYT03062 [Mizuhopecten yessoensis]|uniref:Uncharacterized protein n=1 Tax=Mizuhopecten yessoensis TaxID=6573 RepID=A0A210PJF9_MIZYE|nr:hypothetical protein KP79_PYT03062 [Mizuhopecten yessoensis]